MSSNRTSIRCHCGQKIVGRDVMHTGHYLRLFGPSYVYVKYRCSRCRKVGEQFVKQEEWDKGILRGNAEEVSVEDKETYESLGPIDINEVIDFHFALEGSQDLKSLETPPPAQKKVKQRSSSER